MAVFGFLGESKLSPTEPQAVLMTVSRFHECRYCMTGHTKMSAMQGLDMGVVNAIRDDTPIGDPKLEWFPLAWNRTSPRPHPVRVRSPSASHWAGSVRTKNALGALRGFTRKMVEQRGAVSQTQLKALYAVGYTRETVMEVITAIAFKVMSNFTNHVVGTELDPAAADKVWTPPAER